VHLHTQLIATFVPAEETGLLQPLHQLTTDLHSLRSGESAPLKVRSIHTQKKCRETSAVKFSGQAGKQTAQCARQCLVALPAQAACFEFKVDLIPFSGCVVASIVVFKKALGVLCKSAHMGLSVAVC
jgi:hypothetical protein